MGVDVTRLVFNLEPKYRVTILTLEEWTGRPGTPPAVKRLIWFTDGSRTAEGTGAGVYRQSVGRRLSISLGKQATVFQFEVHALLACIHEMKLRIGQRNMLVFALIVRRFLKSFRLPKQRFHWCDNARWR
jgi:hypothetical protein